MSSALNSKCTTVDIIIYKSALHLRKTSRWKMEVSSAQLLNIVYNILFLLFLLLPSQRLLTGRSRD